MLLKRNEKGNQKETETANYKNQSYSETWRFSNYIIFH